MSTSNRHQYTADVWVRNDAPNPPLRIVLRGDKVESGAIEREIRAKVERVGWRYDDVISVHVAHGIGG